MPRQRTSSWTAFVLPGLPQIGSGSYARGGLYLVMALATAGLAFAVNHQFFLAHVWRFKELEIPDTLIREFYATKQQTFYNFIYLYLALGLVSAVDHRRMT